MECGLRTRRTRGTATVEMAIVLPLLLVLTFGLIEYGWMLLKMQQVTGACRHGARIAILPDASNAGVLAAVDEEMATAGMGEGFTVTFSPADVSTAWPGEPVTVAVSVSYEGNVSLGMPLIPVPGALSTTTTMAKEGP